MMAKCCESHKQVNEQGIGKCSVPMWCCGLPAGFCNKDAYGERPYCKMYRDAWTGREFRADGKYSGYVPFLACPEHGGPTTRVFKDGDMWCAVKPDFINLQESVAGFGETPEKAREELRCQN
jgi:hypothetical protein